jgi:hypothetical protein
MPRGPTAQLVKARGRDWRRLSSLPRAVDRGLTIRSPEIPPSGCPRLQLYITLPNPQCIQLLCSLGRKALFCCFSQHRTFMCLTVNGKLQPLTVPRYNQSLYPSRAPRICRFRRNVFNPSPVIRVTMRHFSH